jgi:hypothetical protein
MRTLVVAEANRPPVARRRGAVGHEMRAADPSAFHVLAFCRGVSDSTPTAIPLEPLDVQPINECFSVVPNYVAAHGGYVVLGWAIWEWPRVSIEAEFHCVWRSPVGHLVDITPKPEPMESITFLLDPARRYRVAK